MSDRDPTREELLQEVQVLRDRLAGLERAEAERRRAEDQLDRSEHFLATAQHVAHLGCWEWDARADRVTWSDELYRIYGLTPEKFDGTFEGYLARVHPEDRAAVRGVVEKTCRDGRPFAMEERIVRPDGTVRVLQTMGEVALDLDGRPLRLWGVCQDITERKRAEEALRSADRRFRALIANSSEAFLLLDPDGTILYNVPAEGRVLGYVHEDFSGRSVLELIHPEDRDAARGILGKLALRPGEAIVSQLRVLHKDGSWRWVEANGRNLLADPGVHGIVVNYQDVTARRQAEEGLRQKERQLQEAQRVAHVGSWEWEVRQNQVTWTDEMYRIYGLRPGERPPSDVFLAQCHVDDRAAVEQTVRQALADHRPFEFEHRVILPDGAERVVHGRGEVQLDAAGQPARLIGTIQDITEARRLEEQLLRAQRMEAVGQLAGGIAHDFNNLLTAILGSISLVRPSLPPEDHGFMEAAEKASLRAAELVRQLLGFSRRTLLRPQPTNLNLSIEDAVTLLRHTIDPRIVIESHTAEHLWSVWADPTQMDQVLMNLCLNARDAMPQGGQLLLETENVVLDEAYARRRLGARAGEFVRLSVRDTGHGIPAEVLPRIFEPFFTTKEPGQGSGLGLAMVFGIVHQHQGWIDCASEPGQSTRFDIYLPRHGASPGGEPAAAPVPAPPRGHETILLVDDEPMIRDLGRSILERHGYQVLLAEDGQEAVEIYQREQGRIALVLLDVAMPRLSGRETLGRLRQLDPQVQVLFTSGYSAEYLQAAEHESVLGFVSKPYRAEDIARAVRQALDAGGKKLRPGDLSNGLG